MAISTTIKQTLVTIGDTIKVKHQFKVDEKNQTQTFQGLLIGIKGKGIGKTFTIRKIASDSIGVEKIWPVQSPNILKVAVVKYGNSRRAKLNYLRKRIGKTALKIKSKAKPKAKSKKKL